jgi:hypothetical protein
MRIPAQKLKRGALAEFFSPKHFKILNATSNTALRAALGMNAAKCNAH